MFRRAPALRGPWGSEGRSREMAVLAEHSAAPAVSPEARPLQIVPIKALPIVAIVLIGMVVAIATNSLWALDFYHVVGGGMWTALDLFLGLVLGPIIGTMSIPSRIEF